MLVSGGDGFWWCPEVIPLLTKGFSALTHWLSRRLWQKSSGSVVPENMDASSLSTDTSRIPMLLLMDVSKQAWINTFSVYTYFKRNRVNLWSVNSDTWYLFLKLSFAPAFKRLPRRNSGESVSLPQIYGWVSDLLSSLDLCNPAESPWPPGYLPL